LNLSKTGDLGEAKNQGCFAVVCYVPDPQKSIIEALRHSIPGKPLSPVHITVLPPRPLPFDVDQANARVGQVVRSATTFEVELSEVLCFPETDFLYLDIDTGSLQIRELHRELNTTELYCAEAYEFRPHITLGGPVPRDLLSETQQRVAEEWRNSSCPRRLRVEELVCLWLAPGSESREWSRAGSFSLQREASRQTAAGAQVPPALKS
jgi:2'-5' RNA ligase